MKKISDKEVKKLLPFTIQEASINTLNKRLIKSTIVVDMYQNENATAQQFFKPISKILQF